MENKYQETFGYPDCPHRRKSQEYNPESEYEARTRAAPNHPQPSFLLTSTSMPRGEIRGILSSATFAKTDESA
jgi:hypothetical protein